MPGSGHGTVRLSQCWQPKDATASRWLWEGGEAWWRGVECTVLACGVGPGSS